MNGTLPFCTVLLLMSVPLHADDTPGGDLAATANLQTRAASAAGPVSPDAKGESGDKSLLGISILGNQEAPKALVIVPWKSSQLGDTLGISRSLDDSRQPVDRDVFMRELTYYEIREGEP